MSQRLPYRLEVKGLVVRFGGVVAVAGVDLSLEAGGAVGLIGPNGAGKSTLLGAISGRLRRTAGEVFLDGIPSGGGSEEACVREGVASTFQLARTYSDLTVCESIEVAVRGSREERCPTIDEAISLAGLTSSKTMVAGDLGPADARFLDLARACATGARVLLVDEPFAGLDELDSRRMRALLGSLRKRRITLVVVEHRLDELVEIVDRILVLVGGRVAAECAATDLMSRSDCLLTYLGATDRE